MWFTTLFVNYGFILSLSKAAQGEWITKVIRGDDKHMEYGGSSSCWKKWIGFWQQEAEDTGCVRLSKANKPAQ